MTDDLDRRLAALGRSAPAPARERLELRASERRRRRLGFVSATASFAAVAVVAGALAVGRGGDDAQPVVTDTSVSVQGPSSTTAPTWPDVPAGVIDQPLLDVEGCEPVDAVYGGVVDLIRTQAFVYRLTEGVVTQAVAIGGDPSRGFAVLMRVRDGQRPAPGDGWTTHPNGGTDGWRTIDEADHVYLRAHGLSDTQVGALFDAIVPRPDEAEVPGVDLAANDVGWEVVDEVVGPIADGPSSSSCRFEQEPQRTVHVYVSWGRPAARFVLALDQPAPLHRFDGESVVSIVDPSRQADESWLDRVVQADDATWDRLVQRTAERPEPVQPTLAP